MTNNGKAKIEKTFNGLNIIIPKKNLFILIFGTIWLSGWFLGFALFEMFASSGIPKIISVFILGTWTIGGLIMIFFLLWGYFGQEKFITDRHEVLFEKTVFGIGKKNRLNISEIKNFRADFVNNSPFGGNNGALFGFGPGKIKFDYGLKTYSFGFGVDEAEAHYIVELLKEQFKGEKINDK